MAASPFVVLRGAALGLGAIAGVLLVQALDEGLSHAAQPLSAGHALAGLVLALVVTPGPILACFVGPTSGEKARGLAVGGCTVTGFVALVGGTMLLLRARAPMDRDLTVYVALGWCAVALASTVGDGVRIWRGAPPPPAP